jgi:Rha family phage regulatory protein
MEELVFKSEKGTPVTNSLMVAEKFGKEHRHVLDSIRGLLTAENSAAKFFIEYEYDNRGKKYPMFIMNRDGFSLLVMGFTGKEALKFKLEYIEAFNKMEETIKTGGFQVPTSFSEALLLAARQQEQIESQQQQLTVQAPKVKYYEDVLSSENLMTITDIAKNYGYSAVSLNEWLRAWGVQYKKGKRYYITAKYQSNDYVRIIPSLQVVNGKTFVVNEMRWTESGRKFIHELLISKGLINRQKSLMI